MRQLWNDIKNHRQATALFLGYWVVAWAVGFLTWQNGMAWPAAVLHLLSLLVAAGLVGWWRAPAREGLLVGRGNLAGGPLAAALVVLIDIALVFGANAMRDLVKGEWKWAGVVEWLLWSAISGVLCLVLGLVGAFIGRTLARVVGPRVLQ